MISMNLKEKLETLQAQLNQTNQLSLKLAGAIELCESLMKEEEKAKKAESSKKEKVAK